MELRALRPGQNAKCQKVWQIVLCAENAKTGLTGESVNAYPVVVFGGRHPSLELPRRFSARVMDD